MMNTIIEGFKEFCDQIFLMENGLKDISLLELEKAYVAYYAEDNEVIQGQLK